MHFCLRHKKHLPHTTKKGNCKVELKNPTKNKKTLRNINKLQHENKKKKRIFFKEYFTFRFEVI